MTRRAFRINDQYGYVLHSSAWRETSLIIQTFTREYGRVAMVAKGAKRPYSVLRPVLSGFQPVLLSWSGTSEIHTLTKAESASVRLLNGMAMMSAWYMNELVLKLLPREDPYPGIFAAYENAITDFTNKPRSSYAGILRQFEWILLDQLGYGEDMTMPDFSATATEQQQRQHLRQRIEDLLDNPLRTRQVLIDLQKY